MKIKINIINSFVVVGTMTLALAAIMKYADYSLVRFLVATGMSMMEMLGIVMLVDSIKERRKKK